MNTIEDLKMWIGESPEREIRMGLNHGGYWASVRADGGWASLANQPTLEAAIGGVIRAPIKRVDRMWSYYSTREGTKTERDGSLRSTGKYHGGNR